MAELLPGPTLADLPDELLENIFSQLHQKRARVGRSRRLRVARHAEANDSCQMPLESRPSEKVICVREEAMALASVCKKWRSACFMTFLPKPWNSEAVIAHPYQLMHLAPEELKAASACGLLNCHITRSCNEPGALYSLHLENCTAATSNAAAKRLLSARIMPGHETLFFLRAKGEDSPIACMTTALFNTSYRLTLDRRYMATHHASPSNQVSLAGTAPWGQRIAEAPAAEITYTSPVTGWLKPRKMRVALSSAAAAATPLSAVTAATGDLSFGAADSPSEAAVSQPQAQDPANSSPRPEADGAGKAHAGSTAAPVRKRGRSQGTDAETLSRSSQLLRSLAWFSSRRPVKGSQAQKDDSGQQRVLLANKAPVWNAQRKCYCLNFLGRVKLESIRNFQLVLDSNPDTIVMQFGKARTDRYIMDYNPKLITAVQAFAIALTSFDRKVLL